MKEVNNGTITKSHKLYMDHIGKLLPRIIHAMSQSLKNKSNIYFMKNFISDILLNILIPET